MWYGKFESARVFEPRPSRQLLISLTLLYAATLALVVLMLPLWLALPLLGLLLWRGGRDWQCHYGHRRIVRLVAGAPGRWFVHQADGIRQEVTVAAASVVHSRLLMLMLVNANGWRGPLVLPRDALAAEAHRRLRVLLWCRGEPDTQEDEFAGETRWWRQFRLPRGSAGRE